MSYNTNHIYGCKILLLIFLGRDLEEYKKITLKNSSLWLISDVQTQNFERNWVEEERTRKWRSIFADEKVKCILKVVQCYCDDLTLSLTN